jgi:hypothetical protein
MHTAVDGNGRPLTVLDGTDWHRFILPRYDLSVPTTADGNHLPWTGWHPNAGPTVNFAAHTGLSLAQKEPFLNQYTYGDPFRLKDLPSSFTKEFPKFTCAANEPKPLEILKYGESVARHCYDYKVYCPPIHTVHNMDPYGWWFSDLPLPAQRLANAHMSGLILSRLQAPAVGLRKYVVFHDALSKACGYAAFVEILRTGRHPRLHLMSHLPPMPRQRTGSVRSYLHDWSNYLFTLALAGEVLSDFYVAMAIASGLHRSFAPIQARLHTAVDSAALNLPVPKDLAVDMIAHTLTRWGRILQLPNLLEMSPSDRTPPAPVRQLVGAQDAYAREHDYDPDSTEAQIYALIQRRRGPSGPPGLCFFCRHPTNIHKRAECPLVKAILADSKYQELAAGLRTLMDRDNAVRMLADGPPLSSLGTPAADDGALDDSDAEDEVPSDFR